jgi:hypothetical protein
VDAGIFHALHVAWLSEICKTLNRGLLPEGYYALPEQHTGRSITELAGSYARPPAGDMGGTTVSEAPPKVRRHETIQRSTTARRRTLAVRYVGGHRLTAVVEILLPLNKARAMQVEAIAAKAVDALDAGVHLLVVDLFPPGSHDPYGMHGVICQRLEGSDEPYDLPADEPLKLAAFAAGSPVEIYLEHVGVGAALPDMPLFIRPDRYVSVPLEPTYQAAYAGIPAFWRDVLEGRPPQSF